MAGDGRGVDMKFGEQRRGENLGTRAGLGKQGRNRCWYVLLVHGYDKSDSSLGGKMEWGNNGRGDHWWRKYEAYRHRRLNGHRHGDLSRGRGAKGQSMSKDRLHHIPHRDYLQTNLAPKARPHHLQIQWIPAG